MRVVCSSNSRSTSRCARTGSSGRQQARSERDDVSLDGDHGSGGVEQIDRRVSRVDVFLAVGFVDERDGEALDGGEQAIERVVATSELDEAGQERAGGWARRAAAELAAIERCIFRGLDLVADEGSGAT